jgi:ATP-binding cassette subfamily B protein
LTALLAPYRRLVLAIVGFTVAANALNLLVPWILSRAIDAFVAGTLVVRPLVLEFVAVAGGIFLFTYLQNVAQVVTSERVARDLRTRLVDKLSTQDLAYIQRVTTATLLTNLTSDVDAVKLFVSQAVGALISSVFLILGASILLLTINWKLGLAVIAVLPIIAIMFHVVLARVRALFAFCICFEGNGVALGLFYVLKQIPGFGFNILQVNQSTLHQLQKRSHAAGASLFDARDEFIHNGFDDARAGGA